MNLKDVVKKFKEKFQDFTQNTVPQKLAQVASSKSALALGKAQEFVESNKSIDPFPTFKAPQNANMLTNFGIGVANLPSNIGNTIIGKGILNPASDVGRIAGATFTGQQLPDYNTLKSGVGRLGYQFQGSKTGAPQTGKEYFGNIADIANAPFTAYSGGKVFGLGQEAVTNAGKQYLVDALKSGAVSGAKYGAVGGLLEGLSKNKDISNDWDYRKQVALNTAIGATGGAILGSLLSGVGYTFEKAVQKRISQGISREQAVKEVKQYGRDELGRFAGNPKPKTQEPKWYSDMRKENGLPPHGDEPQIGLSTKSNPGKYNELVKERGLTTSIKETPNVTKILKKQVNSTYIPKPNEKLMGEAKVLLNEGVDLKLNKVEGIDKKVAATIQEAINLDKSGNHEAAANLFNNLSEQGTELGRGVQAFSLLDKMSPEAISLSVAGKIKKYNINATRKIPELTGDQQALISNAVSKIDSLTGRDKNIAINELSNTINSFIPSSIADKAITVWKAGLLTSLRTHERNLLGNTIMSGSEIAKDIPASIADRIMGLKTGQRTLTTTVSGLKSGTSKGLQASKDIIKYGFDPEEAISKFDVKKVNWGNNKVERVLKGYTEAVFRTLGAEDKPFWNSMYARSLYDQAGAEAINAGKQGDKQFISQLVNKPTEEMFTNALKDANYATFHDKNALSSVASAIKRAAQNPEYKGWGEAGKVLTEVLAPFTGVPSSIAGKTIAYSPIGLVKGAINAGRVLSGNVPELQRQAAQEIGRGVMGTGLFALGAYLMDKGLMTGQPKDTKEANQWQLENKQANSVLVNGKWRSINSVGPQFLVTLAGAKYAEEKGKPDGSTGAYLAGLGKDQLSQTFLAGVQGPLNAITDPARYGQSYVGNQTASVIPNIVKDASKAFDPNARELNSVLDYMKSGIPGVRNTLTEKRDVLGNIVPQEPTGAGAFVDLLNSKTPIKNPVINELSRLNDVGQNATPSKLSKDQTINGIKQKLTPEQLNILEAKIGPEAMKQLENLFKSNGYQSLTDEDKANAISSVMTSLRKQVRGGIDLAQNTTTQTKVAGISSDSSGLGNFMLINPDTGSVKNVDLSKSITRDSVTGVESIDKLSLSAYKSDINARVKDIYALYQDKQITLDQAKTEIDKLQGQLNSTKKPKKISIKFAKTTVPKVNIKKARRVKLAKIKFSKPKITTRKTKRFTIKA